MNSTTGIYRPNLEAGHVREYIAVDIEIGDYETAVKALDAARALRERKPGATLHLMRVGSKGEAAAAYRLGGRGLEPEVQIILASKVDAFDAPEVRAVIDTGFTGELTLPEELIRELGYLYVGSADGVLADGSESLMHFYEGAVLRHGGRGREVNCGGRRQSATYRNGTSLRQSSHRRGRTQRRGADRGVRRVGRPRTNVCVGFL